MKEASKFVFISILFVLAACFVAWRDAEYLLKLPLPIQGKQLIEIESGSTLSASLKQLADKTFLEPRRLLIYLKLYARLSGKADQIKAGEYELQPGMNSLDLLSMLVSGKAMLHEIQLIEGWNFKQILAAVKANPNLVHTLETSEPTAIMQAIDQETLHPEGRFFPDTYRFTKETTDVAFLRRAFSTMQIVLNQEWAQREPDLPYKSPLEALIMASIVEKETGAASERAQIAGVFVRRLLLGMRLQTDPTVIYGMGERFNGNLRRADLLADTPYNSYTRKGLPPTPICSPGRAAIHAALHPAEGKTLFFVARKDGTHQFSETLRQHNNAVRQFQLKKSR